jgi:arsenical pump membrane protein
LRAGGILALLTAAVNNLPATLTGVLALHTAPVTSSLATYAIMLGVDIGAKLTPFGSLATLLWLGILRRHGIAISWGRYLRENWWVTMLALAAAFGALLAANAVLG